MEWAERIRSAVASVFHGARQAIDHLLVALLCEGHVLIEDVPGVGKTTLARALAASVNARFCRVQFTPDLLPADILGVSIYSRASEEFELKKGPVFTNFLLADEINRSTPRTQSALLEAMNEFTVSIDGRTIPLPRPFLVLATQNPHEFEGTYPLPESQLDRFFMRLSLGYPEPEQELRIFSSGWPPPAEFPFSEVVSLEDIRRLGEVSSRVHVDESLKHYVLKICVESRASEDLSVGVSPRGGLFLVRAAQARALLDRRSYVLPDDIKELALPVLAHRVTARRRRSDASRRPEAEAIEAILDKVEVPV